jgi:phage-related protein
MSSFPSLTYAPSYPIKEEREDSAIKSKTEGGYEISRQRFTRVRRKWYLGYQMLPETDIATLRTFVDVTVKGGADYFTWTNPMDSNTYTVRFEKPPTFSAKAKSGGITQYQVDFVLQEV